MPDLPLPGLAERLGLTPEDIQPNAGVIAYAPWDNTNTIQKDPEFYNSDAAKIAKDCLEKPGGNPALGRREPWTSTVRVV